MAVWTPGSVLESLFKVDQRVARVLLIGLGVLAAVAIVGMWQIDESRVFPTLLWLIGGYVIFAFLANMPGWLGAVMGSLACLGIAAYLGLFAVQLVAQNILTPPLMAAGCFFNPGVQGCPLNMIPPSERRDPVTPGAPAGGAGGQAVVVEPGGGGQAAVAEPRDELAPGSSEIAEAEGDELDLSGYRVYVQFSSSRLGAENVDELVAEMIANGWIVAPDAESLPSAFGLNEVRYFHPEDEEAAHRLAGAVSRIAPWADEVRVRDFTRLSDAAKPGLLEVWTSG